MKPSNKRNFYTHPLKRRYIQKSPESDPIAARIAVQPKLERAVNPNGTYFIGIDPGVNTGLAVWHKKSQSFLNIETLPVHRAMERVRISRPEIIQVVIEQPPVNFGARNQFRAQGAGSIKRDFKMWVDFLADLQIPYLAVRPSKRSMTKMNAKDFIRLTKYAGSTNQHGRDAAGLVFGK